MFNRTKDKKSIIRIAIVVILVIISLSLIPFSSSTINVYPHVNNQNNVSTDDNGDSKNILWDKLSQDDKTMYYERVLLLILGPYIRQTLVENYGESRQYDNAKILYMKPIKLEHEIKVEVSTFVGPHNPPYGIDTITLLLDNGKISVIEYDHTDN